MVLKRGPSGFYESPREDALSYTLVQTSCHTGNVFSFMNGVFLKPSEVKRSAKHNFFFKKKERKNNEKVKKGIISKAVEIFSCGYFKG